MKKPLLAAVLAGAVLLTPNIAEAHCPTTNTTNKPAVTTNTEKPKPVVTSTTLAASTPTTVVRPVSVLPTTTTVPEDDSISRAYANSTAYGTDAIGITVGTPDTEVAQPMVLASSHDALAQTGIDTWLWVLVGAAFVLTGFVTTTVAASLPKRSDS